MRPYEISFLYIWLNQGENLSSNPNPRDQRYDTQGVIKLSLVSKTHCMSFEYE